MMNCLCVVAPTDEELVRYALDGEILPMEAEEHLGHCLICQQRLDRYVSTNNFLLQHLYRSQCPDTMTLVQYCQNMLSTHDEHAITSHLELCPLCASDVAETRSLILSSPPLSVTDLPPQVRSPSALPYRRTQKSKHNEKGLHRTTHEVSIWPIEYRANTTQLSLAVSYDDYGNILLSGKLLNISPDKTDGNAQLFAGVKAELYYPGVLTELEECSTYKIDQQPGYTDDPLFTVCFDEPGTILLPSVPPGKYLLIVHLPDTAMVIEELYIIERDQTESDHHRDL
jgi:hypothetical protein